METESTNKLAWVRVLLLILPYFIVVGIFQFAGAYVVGANIMNPEDNDATMFQHFVIKSFDLVGTFLILWVFMKYVDKEPFVNLGFQIKNRKKDFWVGVAAGGLIMLIGYLILIVFKEIVFVKVHTDIKDIIISVLLFTVVAVVEETLLRGYVLRNFMYSFNNYVALIVSSVLFAAMHGMNPNIDAFALLNLFLAGILLGISYIYTKNLWFPIGLHLGWNLFQTYFGFNVSGIDAYSIIEFNIVDPNKINGGAFGFEGSYLSIAAQFITITCVVLHFNKKKMENNSQLA